jgi:hypothetical protein
MGFSLTMCVCASIYFYFEVVLYDKIKLNGVVWQWKEKYANLENKRNALRHAVNILQPQIDRFQADNAKLRKG